LIHRFPFGYLLMLNINSFRVFAFHFLKWYWRINIGYLEKM
jgi:hypothetical protein